MQDHGPRRRFSGCRQFAGPERLEVRLIGRGAGGIEIAEPVRDQTRHREPDAGIEHEVGVAEGMDVAARAGAVAR